MNLDDFPKRPKAGELAERLQGVEHRVSELYRLFLWLEERVRRLERERKHGAHDDGAHGTRG